MPKKIACFSLLLISLAAIPVFCRAQNKPLFALPDSIEMSGLPGETLSGKFTVFNEGELAVKMKIAVKNFRQKDGGLDFFWSEEQSICHWLIPSIQTLDLAAGEKKEIGFLLDIPPQAQTGGYLGAILMEAANTQDIGPKNSFGILVLANVLPSAQAAKDIKAQIIELASNKINNSFPIGLALKTENSTNYNASLNGELTITDWRGKIVTKQKFANLFIFPQSEKTFNWKWNGKSAFGIFKAQIALASADGSQANLASNSFFVITWPAILAFLAIIAFAAAIIKFRKKIYSPQTQTWFNFQTNKKKRRRARRTKLTFIKDINPGPPNGN